LLAGECSVAKALDVEIRRLSPLEFKERLPEFEAIYRDAYSGLSEYRYDRPSRIRHYLQWLYQGDPEGFLVAFEGGKPVGFIGVHSDWVEDEEVIGEIHEFVVEGSAQGKGIGKRLFEEALSYLLQKGRKKVGLWVGERNQRAIDFYLRNGFRKKGQWGKWVRMERVFEDAGNRNP